MAEEVGGSAQGEPFGIEDVLDLHDQCEKLKIARVVMGDEWIRTNLHEEPDLLEADLRERREQARGRLLELTRH